MDKARLALREGYPGDWSDNLTAVGEQLIAEAEQLYGERDRVWSFLGVQVGDFEMNLTYPVDKERKLAFICLQRLLPNHMPDFLTFNLAHETVHMLSPPDADQVTYLEEGVAVVFSLTRSTYVDPTYLSAQQKILEEDPENKYTVAWKDVVQLIRAKPDVIGKLRDQNKSLSRISAGQIIDTAPNCDRAVAERLSRKFNP